MIQIGKQNLETITILKANDYDKSTNEYFYWHEIQLKIYSEVIKFNSESKTPTILTNYIDEKI